MLTQWLINRTIKDPEAVQRPAVRDAYGNLASLTGIVVNLLLSGAKFFSGLIAGSIAITADAVNNLSDAGAAVISLLSFKLAAKPPDREHPFGHARIEYIASSIVAVIIMVLGFNLGVSSVQRILRPEAAVQSPLSTAILIVSILIKLWLFFFYRGIDKRIDSHLMKANATDSLSDVLATGAVLASLLLSPLVGFDLDGFMGLIVAVLIFYAGIQILKKTLNTILGLGPSPELIRQITDTICAYPGVLGIHDLIVHDYGPGRIFASVHVEVDAKEPILESHDLIDNIERNIALDQGIHLVIHMDPLELYDKEVNEMQSLAEAVVQAVDPRLGIHDFRLARGATRRNLIFDVQVPPEFAMSDRELLDQLIKGIHEHGEYLYAVITIDRTYTALPSNKVK